METQFDRTEKLIGAEALRKLAASRVAVFGLGGVGGSCAEALARTGVGSIDLFDNDVVTLSNINRQAVAFHSTVGRYKTEVMAERIRDINPECKVQTNNIFYTPDTSKEIDLSLYDCVIDAIDTVSGKVELIVQAKAAGAIIISSMGAGNKMDPTKFVVTDIYDTDTDPLAKVMRKELRQRGIKDVRVVWSKEPPRKAEGSSLQTGPVPDEQDRYPEDEYQPQAENSQRTPASNSFVPPAAGLILAAEAVKHLIS